MARGGLGGATCNSGCGRPIVWITTPDGKKVPLDMAAAIYQVDSDPRLSEVRGHLIPAADRRVAGSVGVSHFATCSAVVEFSKSKNDARFLQEALEFCRAKGATIHAGQFSEQYPDSPFVVVDALGDRREWPGESIAQAVANWKLGRIAVFEPPAVDAPAPAADQVPAGEA